MKKSILFITTALSLSLIGCGNTVSPETGTESSIVARPITETPTPEPTVVPTPVSSATPEVENTQAPSVGNGMTENAPELIQTEDFLIEEMDPTTMYVTETVSLREGPNTEDFSEQGTLWSGEAVSVIGVVNSYKEEECLWYRLNTGEFISSDFLSTEQPAAEQPTTQIQPTQPQTKEESPLSGMTDQEIQDIFNEVAGSTEPNTGSTTADGRPFYEGREQTGGDAAENGWSGTSHNWSN